MNDPTQPNSPHTMLRSKNRNQPRHFAILADSWLPFNMQGMCFLRSKNFPTRMCITGSMNDPAPAAVTQTHMMAAGLDCRYSRQNSLSLSPTSTRCLCILFHTTPKGSGNLSGHRSMDCFDDKLIRYACNCLPRFLSVFPSFRLSVRMSICLFVRASPLQPST